MSATSIKIAPAIAGGDDKAPAKRSPELDGIRGLAILMVMSFHFLTEPLSHADASWAVLLGKGTRLFWSGVDLFFVLSGYLIGGILLKNRSATNYFKVFFVRRTCRIWPLYFVSLALFIAVRAFGGGRPGYEALDLGPVPLWSYFVFVQNILMSIHHSFGADWLSVTWSLAVEEQFYLVLPFMVKFLPGRRLVYAAMFGIVGAVLLRMYFSRDFLVYVSAPTRADSVLAGLLLAVGMQTPSFRTWLEQHARALMALMVLGGGGMVALTLNHRLVGEGLYLWTALFYAGLVALLAIQRPKWVYQCMTARWLQFVGIVSYGVYLFHPPAFWAAHRLLGFSADAKHHVVNIFTVAGLAAVLTMAAAVICHFGFERAFVRMGHRLSYQRP